MENLSRMARNYHLDGFLQFYSQAEAGNGLTRGLETDLAKRTYVPTKLDRDLTPALLRGELRLVILTGNAGDGKTAFIQTVENHAVESGSSLTRIEESAASSSSTAGFTALCMMDRSIPIVIRMPR